ncbi:MAG: hypothetical protein JO250_21525, partial [Armatimonadetes bacterium]|nr:hypothetical protein [Armatimonadota bacterium]
MKRLIGLLLALLGLARPALAAPITLIATDFGTAHQPLHTVTASQTIDGVLPD